MTYSSFESWLHSKDAEYRCYQYLTGVTFALLLAYLMWWVRFVFVTRGEGFLGLNAAHLAWIGVYLCFVVAAVMAIGTDVGKRVVVKELAFIPMGEWPFLPLDYLGFALSDRVCADDAPVIPLFDVETYRDRYWEEIDELDTRNGKILEGTFQLSQYTFNPVLGFSSGLSWAETTWVSSGKVLCYDA